MPTARDWSIHVSASLARSPGSSYLERVVKETSMTTKRLIAFGGTESDFEMYVHFILTPFTIDDLVAQFGPRVRVLP
jgi:hypothetical protein